MLPSLLKLFGPSHVKVVDSGAWVAQWVKASAFGSGHGLRVPGSSPTSGSLLSGEPASPSLLASLPTYDLLLSVTNL